MKLWVLCGKASIFKAEKQEPGRNFACAGAGGALVFQGNVMSFSDLTENML